VTKEERTLQSIIGHLNSVLVGIDLLSQQIVMNPEQHQLVRMSAENLFWYFRRMLSKIQSTRKEG